MDPKPADTGGRAITGYRIEVSTDGGTTFTALVAHHDTMQDGAIVTAYTHTGLTLGDVRHYRVKARNADGDAGLSSASNVATATTVHPDAPGAPTGLSATAVDAAPGDTTTAIALAWTEPADTGATAITSYRIDVSSDEGATFTTLVANHAVMESGAIVTAYTHTDLASEATRHYRVLAINDAGTGLPSNVADATTADIVAPSPQSASVPAAGTALTVVFDEALDATTAGAPAKPSASR